ncbi:MAG: hypothetical protein ACXAC7_14130 [Candidatus Hodarchaeales archaeon]|jgi:uncharacterized coiled-coil DUF342 family protein
MVQTTETVDNEEKKNISEQEETTQIESSSTNSTPEKSDETDSQSEINKEVEKAPESTPEKSDEIDSQSEINKEVEKAPEDTKESKKSPEIIMNINVNEMNIDELRSEIRNREDIRSDVLDKLKEINKERNHFKDIRDKFNKESMENFQKVSELKEKRDFTNSEIRELKQMRSSVLSELKQFSSREKEIFESLKRAEGNRGQKTVNPRRITKQIEKLEWTLQTTAGVTLDQEREIMERIDELNDSLETAQSTESVQRELRDIRKRKSTLKSYLDDSWKQLNELVGASQSRHQRLSELYEKGKSAKKEADHNHKLFLQKIKEANEFRKQLRVLRAELDVFYPRYKSLQEQRKKDATRRRIAKNMRVKDEKTKEIQKKLVSKKGLSMDEMKFLMDQKLISLNKEKQLKEE